MIETNYFTVRRYKVGYCFPKCSMMIGERIDSDI